MLILTCHGGNCCGINHISGFWEEPEHVVQPYSFDMFDQRHKLPAETAYNRFIRLLGIVLKERQEGYIECVLVEDENPDEWWSVLKDLGFESYVPNHPNSNTNNTLEIFHLLTDEDCADKISKMVNKMDAVNKKAKTVATKARETVFT